MCQVFFVSGITAGYSLNPYYKPQTYEDALKLQSSHAFDRSVETAGDGDFHHSLWDAAL